MAYTSKLHLPLWPCSTMSTRDLGLKSSASIRSRIAHARSGARIDLHLMTKVRDLLLRVVADEVEGVDGERERDFGGGDLQSKMEA
ncbi:hypothetical protein NL676_038710 [Syzygium grande]|nr:hypothetical protein NL676_038710 [Syzygium grande]